MVKLFDGLPDLDLLASTTGLQPQLVNDAVLEMAFICKTITRLGKGYVLGEAAFSRPGSIADAILTQYGDAPDEAADAGLPVEDYWVGSQVIAGTLADRTGLAVADLRRHWPEILEDVKGRRRFAWLNLSQYAQVVELRDGALVLAFSNAGAKDSFARSGCTDVLRESLVDRLGLDVRVECISTEAPADDGAPPQAGTPTPLRPRPAATAGSEDVSPPARFDQARAAIAAGGAAAADQADPDDLAAIDDPEIGSSDDDAEALLRTMLNAEIIDDEAP